MAPTQVSLTADRFQTNDLPDAPDRVDDPTPAQQEALAKRAQAHAVEVADNHDYDVDPTEWTWETSTNAQRTRRAGDCRYNVNGLTGEVTTLTITLTWQAYVAWGWEKFSETVRHELAHAIDVYRRGKSDHGTHFWVLAQELDTHRHCESFHDDDRVILRCGCGCELPRNKASKLVKNPGNYSCKEHSESLTAEHTDTGRTWDDVDGYETERAAIEADSTAEW